MPSSNLQQPLPIQPVERPILCSPYTEPAEHWVYDTGTGAAQRMPGRRPASYWYKTQRALTTQLAMFAEEQREDLPLVNSLRQDVKRWRGLNYEGATQVTKELLAYWQRPDRQRRLFFCQLEAVETVIYLNEIVFSGRRPRFKPALDERYLRDLIDPPDAPHSLLLPPQAGATGGGLTRLALKMATGSGKTVVMAMLIAWAFCNRGQVSSDGRFPRAVLVVCPNLTIKERLQVLRPENPDNYFARFDLVPSRLRPHLASGVVQVTNWHIFNPESEHVESGKSYKVVDKGPEGPEAFARRVLGDLYSPALQGGLLVLNDEAHHAWRPAISPDSPSPDRRGGRGVRSSRAETVSSEDLEEATIWVAGLDTLNAALGLRFCIDLSATPFYIAGSGFIEGSPLRWIVSDFGLVDAIESGIVKIPRLPVSDTTGRPEPRYFRLWEHIVDNLQPGERLPGRAGRPDPEVVYREAEPALNTLASQWVERFRYIQDASNQQDKTPPVLIIVCDNTEIAEVFYRSISGAEEQEVVEAGDDPTEDEDASPDGQPDASLRSRSKTRKKIVYGQGRLFPEYFSNRPGFTPTIRIDSKLLAKAESEDPTVSRQEAAELLRRVVATVGKPGQPGEGVRCVVSVAMLNEGWDANNVTHILGLRAFTSQLLCEQVVGRGLRRMDYTPDPATGLLTEEYVDIYGVPFSLIPFKGRAAKTPAPEDRPKNHVFAMPERSAMEIRFPVVEGYAFALQKNQITADVAALEPIRIEPESEPTAVFVQPRIGYQMGAPAMNGPGEYKEETRQLYYESTHLQQITFELSRQLVHAMVGDQHTAPDPKSNPRLRLQARHQLFPQVYRIAETFIRTRVDYRGVDPREIGQQKYFARIFERLLSAIRPDDSQGEPPLMPLLNRYAPTGSTAGVNFKTVQPVFAAHSSHLNAVAADTATWEQSAAFRLELAALHEVVLCYARNDQLNFTIPYEFMGVSFHYEPDFLVRLADGTTLILEIKGFEDEQDRAKHAAANRWVAAVNNWGQLNRWRFHVNRDPHMLEHELKYILSQTPA